MENTNTSNKQQEFLGKFITLRPKTNKPFKWPDVVILIVSEKYQMIEESLAPHDPAKKLTGREFENELDSFINHYKNHLSGKTVEFSTKYPMKYNIKNGLIVVYSYDRLSVAKVPYIWEESLKIIGYTRDESLPVPFSNGEAYYDVFRDELHAIW